MATFYVAPFFFIYYYYYYSESGYFLQLYRYVYVWVDSFLVLPWSGFCFSCAMVVSLLRAASRTQPVPEEGRLLWLQPDTGRSVCSGRLRVFALDSINHMVDFWYKNIHTIPETAGMFQPFVTHIAWLCAPFSFLLWNLTALIVAQMFWVVLTIFF